MLAWTSSPGIMAMATQLWFVCVPIVGLSAPPAEATQLYVAICYGGVTRLIPLPRKL